MHDVLRLVSPLSGHEITKQYQQLGYLSLNEHPHLLQERKLGPDPMRGGEGVFAYHSS